MKSTKRTRCFLLLALASAMHCGVDGLEGSIGEALSLDYDEVQIYQQNHWLVVEYLQDSARGTEKICKLVADTEGIDLVYNRSFELEDEAFLARVDVQRSTFANELFPEPTGGRLRLDMLELIDGGSAHGDFLILFTDSKVLEGWFGGTITAH